MGAFPLKEGGNIVQVSTPEFVVIVEAKNPKFWKGYEIRRYDERKEVVVWTNGLLSLI